jgi:hypothetical protein
MKKYCAIWLKLGDAEIRQLYLDKTIVRDPLLERENP